MYKIYSLTKYSDNKGLVPIESDDINIITDNLKDNKGYHLKLIDDINYKLYFDIDHIPNNYFIHSILTELSDMFDIDISDIKYTESIKQTEYSYHLVIPKFICTKDTIKHFIKNIKTKDNFKYYEETPIILNKYFDDSVYNENQLFRLPNQTLKKDKPIEHTIKNGNMEDFILNYIDVNRPNILTIHQEQDKVSDKKKKNKKDKVIKKSITYLTDEQLINLLDKLDDDYCDDYSKWTIITNIFKGIDKYKIWDDWSKKSDSYNRFKNLNIWKNTKKIIFNINYLINLTNTTDIYKQYIPLTIRQPDIIFNNQFVSPETDNIDFNQYNTIIIKSTTGTGKTTAIAKKLKDYKILSIVSRITLGEQIISSFKKENIIIDDYRTTKYNNQNYNVCINSLLKVDMDDDVLSETVIYIDEINSFVKHLMMLQNVDIKSIFIHLLYLIKNCKLLILTDAIISDGVFQLIKSRDNNIYFLENQFKKFKDTKAIRILDEVLFKDKIEDRIKNNNYGLFGFDSKTITTAFYDDFISKYPDKIDSFLLITADHPFEIKDASIQFKNKFVFFSPSITTAVDFSINISQDVFIYIKGNTIDPSESFQQATRTRNIKNLYYYIKKGSGEEQYDDLENCSQQFLTLTKTAELINNNCSYIDENDEIKIANSTFFKLFIYIQYVSDIYNTNKLKHFQLILEQNEFILSEEGTPETLNKTELLDASKELQLEELNKFLLDPTNPKYDIFDKRIKLLNIPLDKDIITKYSDYILSPFKLDDYLNTIRFFKDEKYLQKKIEIIKNTNYSVKWMSSIYNKILLFRHFEKKYNISLDSDYLNKDLLEMPKDEIDLYKKVFLFKFVPKTKGDLLKVYISMMKHITGTEIIKTSRKQIKNIKKYHYIINDEYINKILELNKYQNPHKLGFDIKYKKELDLVDKPEIINGFIDTSLLDLFLD